MSVNSDVARGDSTARFSRNRAFAVTFLVFNCCFLAAYLFISWVGAPNLAIRELFDLDAEGTLPAWLTSTELLLAGVLFLAASGARLDPPDLRHFLRLAGLGLVFLSIDETVGIHEKITRLLRPVEVMPRFSGNHGMWIPIYLFIGFAFVAVTVKYWRLVWKREPRGTGILALGALLFLIGAVGLEIVGYGEIRHAETRTRYILQVAAEEFFELCGATAVFIGSLEIYDAFAARDRAVTPH